MFFKKLANTGEFFRFWEFFFCKDSLQLSPQPPADFFNTVATSRYLLLRNAAVANHQPPLQRTLWCDTYHGDRELTGHIVAAHRETENFYSGVMQDSAFMAGLYSTTEAGPGLQAPACSSIPGGANWPDPLKCQAARKSIVPGYIPADGKCDVGYSAFDGRSHCTLVQSGANRWPA